MFYKTQVIGRLGADAKHSIVDGGGPVVNFSLCYSRKFKKNNGSDGEFVQWIECSVWKKPGESIDMLKEHLLKGKMIFCEGEVTPEVFQNSKGESQAVLKMRVNNLDLLLGS